MLSGMAPVLADSRNDNARSKQKPPDCHNNVLKSSLVLERNQSTIDLNPYTFAGRHRQ